MNSMQPRLPGKMVGLVLLLVAVARTASLGPLPNSAVPQQIQQLLSTNAPDQWWFHTHLGADPDSSEYFAVYQAREPLGFEPQVAWISGGKLRFHEQLDADAEFSGAREFRLDPERSGIAVAFHFAADRSGTWFRIYAASGQNLQLLQDFQVVEGQLEIVESPSGARLQIWQEAGPCNAGEAFCVWCLHRYRVDEYRWSRSNSSSDFRTASTASSLPAFYLLSRHAEEGCRDPKLFHKEPIVGVRAPASVSKGIEGEP